ncbi:MAG: DeoR/GlpR family DNA-binding transcription regulator [Paenibacillus dendritiformis]|uniref:DeoR/GlpR family DNA-binding transcription regulator n=1 Tax=Paenibacillus dendritiformis TaxID=130049 RepID=UPI00143DC03C|nr:DeoR/GlpR family DNA-binding transcription regulator [Paenibacillus dendritiformis]MDU5143692.1 DeoR/GlpR family DNA-binding transcription regulator [Paenibacillus dendritiformis]NKI23437.1 DeoR/GlpR transcriptional regulator [Paenibacillus dendritiformis]NRG00433.1 DeoR/GlpR transcriptional regulator [Paenibacillus dendritiformis]GIO75056.1 putative HTH-type transcriptional regulator YulB [Paenibacillus dendritiformis]
MLPVARKAKIKEIIMEQKSVTVAALTSLFNVTEETIRRDLKQLEDEGVLIRTYGGAYVPDGVQNDVNVNLREHIHVDGKKRMAERCAEFIANGDSIFLDASTTSLYIAQQLENKRITVVTNSLKIANALLDHGNVHLVMIGGGISSSSMSALGRNAELNMNSYFFDLAFISCRSVSMQHGITDSNEQQAEVRRLAVERANKVYLVADFTKFDRTSFASICPLDRIHTLVTDKQLGEDWHEFLDSRNISLHECV